MALWTMLDFGGYLICAATFLGQILLSLGLRLYLCSFATTSSPLAPIKCISATPPIHVCADDQSDQRSIIESIIKHNSRLIQSLEQFQIARTCVELGLINTVCVAQQGPCNFGIAQGLSAVHRSGSWTLRRAGGSRFSHSSR